MHKFIQVIHERESATILSGRVEVDDAYLGGQRSGGKVGLGSDNKIPFVAASETNEEGHHPLRAVFSPVTGFTSEAIAQWARRSLSTNTSGVLI